MTNLFRGPGLGRIIEAFVVRGRPESGRAKRGLFAGKDVGFGNMVSHSQRKTRRMWKPNVHRKRVWSDTLGEMVRFNMTTAALRMIDKCGGLDRYLLATSDKKLDSESGIKVKRKIEWIIYNRALQRQRDEEEAAAEAAVEGAGSQEDGAAASEGIRVAHTELRPPDASLSVSSPSPAS